MSPEVLGTLAVGLAPMLERHGENPLRLVGRVAGLGQAEMNAGIPKWGWLTIGFVGGFAVMWLWGGEIGKKLGRP